MRSGRGLAFAPERLAEALEVSVDSLLQSDFERLPETLDDPELMELIQNVPKLSELGAVMRR